MAETSPKTLKAILERADYALKQLQDAEDNRAFRWKCKRVRIYQEFHSASFIRSDWQMSPM
jgi:hypothetical protein